MNASYDPEVDAYYFQDSKALDGLVHTIQLGQREVNIDYGMDGKIVGIEIL